MSKKQKPDSWVPIYVADYLADTRRLSTEQHGAYFLLILDYWRNGPPPDDDRTLAQITGLALARWKAHRCVIAPKFQIASGVWKHKRIEQELVKAREMQEALSARGKAGAAARWGGEDSPDDATGNATGIQEAQAEGMPESMPDSMLADAPSPSPTPLPEVRPSPPPSPAPKSVARTARAPAKTRLPDGFKVSDRVRQWAAEKGFDRLDDHLENFIGKARAKGYTYADWDEGLMGAIREDWAGFRKGNGSSHQAAIDEAERRIFGGQQERDITDEANRL